MMMIHKTSLSQNKWKSPSLAMMEKYYAMRKKIEWSIQWRGHAERVDIWLNVDQHHLTKHMEHAHTEREKKRKTEMHTHKNVIAF